MDQKFIDNKKSENEGQDWLSKDEFEQLKIEYETIECAGTEFALETHLFLGCPNLSDGSKAKILRLSTPNANKPESLMPQLDYVCLRTLVLNLKSNKIIEVPNEIPQDLMEKVMNYDNLSKETFRTNISSLHSQEYTEPNNNTNNPEYDSSTLASTLNLNTPQSLTITPTKTLQPRDCQYSKSSISQSTQSMPKKSSKTLGKNMSTRTSLTSSKSMYSTKQPNTVKLDYYVPESDTIIDGTGPSQSVTCGVQSLNSALDDQKDLNSFSLKNLPFEELQRIFEDLKCKSDKTDTLIVDTNQQNSELSEKLRNTRINNENQMRNINDLIAREHAAFAELTEKIKNIEIVSARLAEAIAKVPKFIPITDEIKQLLSSIIQAGLTFLDNFQALQNGFRTVKLRYVSKIDNPYITANFAQIEHIVDSFVIDLKSIAQLTYQKDIKYFDELMANFCDLNSELTIRALQAYQHFKPAFEQSFTKFVDSKESLAVVFRALATNEVQNINPCFHVKSYFNCLISMLNTISRRTADLHDGEAKLPDSFERFAQLENFL